MCAVKTRTAIMPIVVRSKCIVEGDCVGRIVEDDLRSSVVIYFETSGVWRNSHVPTGASNCEVQFIYEEG